MEILFLHTIRGVCVNQSSFVSTLVYGLICLYVQCDWFTLCLCVCTRRHVSCPYAQMSLRVASNGESYREEAISKSLPLFFLFCFCLDKMERARLTIDDQCSRRRRRRRLLAMTILLFRCLPVALFQHNGMHPTIVLMSSPNFVFISKCCLFNHACVCICVRCKHQTSIHSIICFYYPCTYTGCTRVHTRDCQPNTNIRVATF